MYGCWCIDSNMFVVCEECLLCSKGEDLRRRAQIVGSWNRSRSWGRDISLWQFLKVEWLSCLACCWHLYSVFHTHTRTVGLVNPGCKFSKNTPPNLFNIPYTGSLKCKSLSLPVLTVKLCCSDETDRTESFLVLFCHPFEQQPNEQDFRFFPIALHLSLITNISPVNDSQIKFPKGNRYHLYNVGPSIQFSYFYRNVFHCQHQKFSLSFPISLSYTHERRENSFGVEIVHTHLYTFLTYSFFSSDSIQCT